MTDIELTIKIDKDKIKNFENNAYEIGEKYIQEHQSKQLIDELSKMPPMVISMAYQYAISYHLYGVDVRQQWTTVTQNASALEKAYKKGYYDALQRQVESEVNECQKKNEKML